MAHCCDMGLKPLTQVSDFVAKTKSSNLKGDFKSMKADSSVFRKDSRSLLSSDHEGSEERLELGCNLISEDHPNGREKSPEDSLSTEMSGPEAFNKKTQTDLKIGSELKRVASVESEKMSFLRKIVITISSCEKVSKKMQSCLTREIMKAERESFTQILSQK